MEIGAIVFSRMSSTRLPGKALLPIGGRPLLGHVFDRARRVDGIRGVALATSSLASDDAIAAFAQEEGVPCWRGSRDDVVARALDCARAQGWGAFVRVCGDRIFMDPRDHRKAVERMAAAPDAIDLVTNKRGGAVPAGLTVEVVRTEALAAIRDKTSDPEDREHLTRYIYHHPGTFSIEDLPGPLPHTEGLRFVVDTWRDLERARAVVQRLYAPAEGSSKTLSRLIREWERANPEFQPIR